MAASPLPIGTVLAGKYRVEAVVGQGGFGVVLLATQLNLGRSVAIKVLFGGATLREDAVVRFRREARLAQRLEHPNTVRIYDFGETDAGMPFICFEYLRGRPLDLVIAQEGRLGWERVAHVATQVLKSLADAHAHGIIHRDVKPSNVFLCEYAGESDFVKVLDFGIAKNLGDDPSAAFTGAGPAQLHSYATAARLTQAGSTLGTPAYMAPEQVCGEAVGPPTDLYALALVMAEALSGQRVFGGEDAFKVGADQLSDAPVPLPAAAVATPLGPILVRATKKRPRDRYVSAGEMLHAIAELRGTGPQQIVVAPFSPSGAQHSWAPGASAAPGARPLATAPTVATPITAREAAHVGPAGGDRGSAPGVVPEADAPRATLPMGDESLAGRGLFDQPTGMATPVRAPLSAQGAPPAAPPPVTGPGVAVTHPELRTPAAPLGASRASWIVLGLAGLIALGAGLVVVGFLFLGWGDRPARSRDDPSAALRDAKANATATATTRPLVEGPPPPPPNGPAWMRPRKPATSAEPPAVDVPGRKFCHFTQPQMRERFVTAGFKVADSPSAMLGVTSTFYNLGSVARVSGHAMVQKFPELVAAKGAEVGYAEDGGAAFGRDGLCVMQIQIDGDDGTAAKALFLEVTR